MDLNTTTLYPIYRVESRAFYYRLYFVYKPIQSVRYTRVYPIVLIALYELLYASNGYLLRITVVILSVF
nr:MAG TPA: hypothetical protein [Caudoviricetes sp.]